MTEKKFNSRRDFLKAGTAAAAGLTLFSNGLTPRVHAGEDNTIKVALVGCGGRGNGAANQALTTKGPTKLVAVADTFEFKCRGAAEMLAETHQDKVDVPRERQFTGFDAYKNAIDAVGPGGVVLLAAPPAFRPIHTKYAVEKGVHIFMEKSFAVDPQGIRSIIESAKKAREKKLNIVTGLMSRHSVRLEEAVRRIQDGAIGDIFTTWVYRVHGSFRLTDKPADRTPLQHQLLNFNCFTWLCGSFILDWMIHNIDVAGWVRGDEQPVSVQGQAGRQVRTDQDNMFDHVALEYRYADGKKMFLQLRQIDKVWNAYGAFVQGTKGTAVIGEGQDVPRIYKGHLLTRENLLWEGNMQEVNKYQFEHDRLFKSVRGEEEYRNEAERGCKAVMTGIIGRIAAESGQEVFLEEQMKSEVPYTPNLESLDLNGDSPLMPDADGTYATSIPRQGVR
ncbi:MAG: Gfo/Idh/MocA family oxidoreductase [Planctomycetaceae bacterium]|nr:Gfo/Idh/MocA family oxidoreductase [Planctomycetaceae bacterium]